MLDYEQKALLRAEKVGVIVYKVKRNIMYYYSFFGSEGIYKVEHNLDTEHEKRTHLKYTKIPKHLENKCNYFCG